jgi:dUTPase
MVGLENRGRDFHLLTNGIRIAQLVITPILNNPYDLTPRREKNRSLNGFGSTGV